MDIEIKRVDPHEGSVEFSGRILISWETKSEFEKALSELIDRYAI